MTKQEALRDLRIRAALAIADVIVKNPYPVGLIMALALNETYKAQARAITEQAAH